MPRLSELPRSFRELYEAGRLDYWTAPYHSLTDADRARLIEERLPRVLWWSTIEWDLSREEILAPPSDQYLRPGLVPFAGDGYGNQYCWYPRWAEGDAEPPVIFASSDDHESGLFARSFIECACRCFVRAHAIWFEDDSPHPREVLWRAHLEILRPHLTSELEALLGCDGKVPSPETCAAIEAEIAARVGERRLITFMMPVEYTEPALLTAEHVADYERSLAFYRELVEVEGYSELSEKLRAVQANLDDAASRLAAGKS
jgi:hypothetical protein